MNKIKRILAGSLALMMSASVMTACGKDDSSNGGNKESSEKSKKTYNIYCWNDEFKSRFETFYWDKRDTKLWEGVEVNWVINTNEGNVYQTKLDEALKTQAKDEMKIDMFLAEADYIDKYVNSDASKDVKSVGITDADMSNMYQYTKDAATDKNGVLKGVTWQAAPGLFLYNAKIAREVLGTDEPDKVQEFVKDWATFEDTAAKMKEAGVAMVAGYDDTYRCFSNNASAPWVDADGNIKVDDKIKAWAEQTKAWSEKGYNKGTSLWDDNWKAGQKIDGGVFGYFFSTWGIPFTLLPNTLDKAVDDGGKEEVGNGGYGEWRACMGPESYFWGGTWLMACATGDNDEITKDIMLKLTCDVDIMADITDKTQDYTNNKASIKKLVDGGYKNAFLGGQDHLSLLSASAEKISLKGKVTAYDQGCNEKFQGAMKAWFTGEVATYEDALKNFKTDITQLYGNLKMD